jgi:glutathione S-transferase
LTDFKNGGITLPVLVVDGHSIAQSGGIARICGKLSGMYSENIIEAGKVDQIIDTVTDINEMINPSMREDNPIIKKQMRAALSNDALPKYFGYLEEILKANNSGWFVGDEMTIADIAVCLAGLLRVFLTIYQQIYLSLLKGLLIYIMRSVNNLKFRSGKK